MTLKHKKGFLPDPRRARGVGEEWLLGCMSSIMLLGRAKSRISVQGKLREGAKVPANLKAPFHALRVQGGSGRSCRSRAL